MKHVSMVDHYDGSSLEDKVNEWILENEENILEIIDIEYTQHGNVYLAIITYEERDEQ
ncbi:hypothetical protein [Clostridium sp. Cult3]|uniref:hypothetical protein n=1 Tax=Clostridium sp. Cult3 TaxID=2079004 RepID=UPI001F26BBDC|nr:hypothetical protein [Clostridium sp. Cult3]